MLDLCDYNNFCLFNQLSVIGSGVVSGGNEVARFVKHENSPWPNVVYDVRRLDKDEVFFNTLRNLIEENNLQPLVFCDAEAVDPIAFKNHKFLPVDRWVKMQLDLDSYEPRVGIDDFVSTVVTDYNSLRDWLEIVSKTLFNDKKLDISLLKWMLERPEFKFQLGTYNNIPVCASLTYTDKNNIAGIYMVSTLPDYQGKGYARALLDNVIGVLVKEGIRTCVLQSTKAGHKLYTQMGFKTFGHLNLYWKLK